MIGWGEAEAAQTLPGEGRSKSALEVLDFATPRQRCLAAARARGQTRRGSSCASARALPVKTLCEVLGLAVTDVFGERTRAADDGSENVWQRWSRSPAWRTR